MIAITEFTHASLSTGLATLVLVAALGLFFALYLRMKRQQQRALEHNLEQLALLRALLADFQRHRGLSNGVLSGDHSMREALQETRLRLDRATQQAAQFASGQINAWRALIGQWRQLRTIDGRDPASNLQAHNRIIRDTIFLIEDIATERDLSGGRDDLQYLHCIWHEVVQTAEWSGQARALGTGIAAAHQSSAAQRVRLRFLHQKIREHSESAFAILKRDFAGQQRLHQCEHAVATFLACMEAELLGTETPAIEARHYFEQATAAVNELLALIDSALGDLNRVHRPH